MNTDSMFLIEIFYKKLENLDNNIDRNLIIQACNCISQVHKLCLIKEIIYSQDTC